MKCNVAPHSSLFVAAVSSLVLSPLRRYRRVCSFARLASPFLTLILILVPSASQDPLFPVPSCFLFLQPPQQAPEFLPLNRCLRSDHGKPRSSTSHASGWAPASSPDAPGIWYASGRSGWLPASTPGWFHAPRFSSTDAAAPQQPRAAAGGASAGRCGCRQPFLAFLSIKEVTLSLPERP